MELLYQDEINKFINGVTFDELKLDAKNKIITLYNKLDSELESRHPNYKEDIKYSGCA